MLLGRVPNDWGGADRDAFLLQSIPLTVGEAENRSDGGLQLRHQHLNLVWRVMGCGLTVGPSAAGWNVRV